MTNTYKIKVLHRRSLDVEGSTATTLTITADNELEAQELATSTIIEDHYTEGDPDKRGSGGAYDNQRNKPIILVDAIERLSF